MLKGEVVYLYAFDAASEIITGKVKEILTQRPSPVELRADHTLPKDIPLYKLLSIENTPYPSKLPQVEVRPIVHIYDVGVISVVMRMAFTVQNLAELLPFHRLTLEGGQTLGQAARELCLETCKSLKDAMVACSPFPEPEACTVFCLMETGDGQPLSAWAEARRREIAGLLTENPPEHLSDLQVEEYRVMDQRLDRYLNKAYGDIQRRRRFGVLGGYSGVLRTLRIDAAKLNDEVTNITKFFGDWYLDARERFHLNQWKSSVEERLKQIDALYSVAHTELTNRRMAVNYSRLSVEQVGYKAREEYAI